MGGEDTSLSVQIFFYRFSPLLTSRIMERVVPVPKNLGAGPKKYLHLDPTKCFHAGPK